MRVELLANRVQGDDAALLQRAGELAQREFDTFTNLLQVVGRVGNRCFEAVDHRQQMFSKAFDRELVGLGDVFLGAAAHVLSLSLRPQEALLQLDNFRLSFGQGGVRADCRRFRRRVCSHILLGCCGLRGLARGFVGGRGILARRVFLRVFHVAESR